MLQKVLLIDDEEPARQLLREYLSDYPDLVVVGEANNGVDAIRQIQELRPEIVFLDVQMPGLTGLEVLARLEELPLVIFSTAYDQYALQAFELHAVDYLLKPYTKERFREAVTRLLGRLEPQSGVRTLAQQMVDERSETSYPDRILVSKGSKLVAVKMDEIIWVAADGDYCRLVTGDKGPLLSQYGIGQLEEKLDPQRFLRVHRSSIVNLDAIEEIFRAGHGYDIRMNNGEVVHVSRGYAEGVKKLIF
jgi:two-component system LytT family response regulator